MGVWLLTQNTKPAATLSGPRASAPQTQQEVAPAADSERVGMTAELPSSGLVVTVTESVATAVRPLAGVDLSLYSMGRPQGSAPARAATSDDGRASLDVDRPVLVVARKTGYSSSAKRVGPNQDHCTIELDRVARLTVRVLHPDGQPRQGSRTTLTYSTAREDAVPPAIDPGTSLRGTGIQVLRREHTDSSGAARFAHLDSHRDLRVEILDPVHGQMIRNIPALEPGEDGEWSITLDQGGAVRVLVNDAFALALPGAEVSATQTTAGVRRVVARGLTDQKGLVTLSGLREGPHRLVVQGWNLSSSDLYLMEEQFNVMPGEITDLGVIQGKGPVLDMTVEVSDEPPSIAAARAVRATFNATIGGSIPSPGGPSFFKTVLPVGRAVRVWTGAQGQWSTLCRLLSAETHRTDAAFDSQKLDLEAPGQYTIEFSPKASPHPEGPAWVSFSLPESSGADSEFVALLHGGGIAALEPVFEGSSVGYRMASPREGAHRLCGVLNGRAIDETIDLVRGEELELGLLTSREPVQLELTGREANGAAIEAAEVCIFMGQYVIASGTVEDRFALPDGLEVTAVLSSGPREVSKVVITDASASGAVDLGILN